MKLFFSFLLASDLLCGRINFRQYFTEKEEYEKHIVYKCCLLSVYLITWSYSCVTNYKMLL